MSGSCPIPAPQRALGQEHGNPRSTNKEDSASAPGSPSVKRPTGIMEAESGERASGLWLQESWILALTLSKIAGPGILLNLGTVALLSFPGAGRRVPWLRAPQNSHCSTWCTLGPGQASAPIQSSRWLGHPRSSPWLPWLSVARGWSEILFKAPPQQHPLGFASASGVGESGRAGQLGRWALCVGVCRKGVCYRQPRACDLP